VECLLEAKKWPKSIPQITDKGVARLVAGELIQASFFHRSDKVEDKKGHLQVTCSSFNHELVNHLASLNSKDIEKECFRGIWSLYLDV